MTKEEMESKEGLRFIPTGLKATPKNTDILEAVRGQMSDGIWENTNGMTSYWMDADIEEVEGNLYISVVKNRSIMYKDYHTYYSRACKKVIGEYLYKWRINKYADMTDKEVVKFFANKIRCIVRHQDKDNLELSSMTEEEKTKKYYLSESFEIPERKDFSWRADNETSASYLNYKSDVTVGDAYKCYKTMRDFMNI